MATLLLSCSKGGNAPAPSASHLLAASPTVSGSPVEDQVLISVSKALRRGKLLNRPDQCYAYRFDPAAAQPAYTVDVRENHNHPGCGGDPQTQPHLFTVRVDRSTHVITQDANSPGTFLPIPR